MSWGLNISLKQEINSVLVDFKEVNTVFMFNEDEEWHSFEMFFLRSTFNSAFKWYQCLLLQKFDVDVSM